MNSVKGIKNNYTIVMAKSWKITGPHFGDAALGERCRPVLASAFSGGGARYIDGYGGVGGIADTTSVTFCGEENGATLGCITLHFDSAGGAEIRVMAVIAERQRSGIGSDLIYAAQAYTASRGVRVLEVKTVPSCIKAIGCYNKHGFMHVELNASSSPYRLESDKTRFLNGCGNRCMLFVKSIQ